MGKTLIILFLTLSGFVTGAITPSDREFKKDSIQKLIYNSGSDAEKSELFFQLAKYYLEEDESDSALFCYHRSYKLLNDTLSSDAEKVLNETGLFYYRQSNFAQALSYFQNSLLIATLNNDSVNMARRYSNIAVIYDHFADYVKSFEYNQKALRIFEQQDSKRGMAFIYNNLGVLSEEMENPEIALVYHRKALKLKKKLDDKSGIGSSLNNMGVVFEHLLPNYDSSVYYYRKAYKVFNEAGDESGVATSLGNIGVIHLSNHRADSAVIYSKKALKIRKSLKDDEGISSSLLNLGRDYFAMKEYKMAKSYFQQGLKLSNKIGSRKRTSDIYEALAMLFSKTKENGKAYDYHIKYSQLKDSLLNEENSKQIAELKTRYELEKKNKQLNVLSHQNQLQKESITGYNFLLGAMLVIGLLIAFITILLVRQNRLTTQRQTAELQQKLLRSQMNPHFIFNTLFSIQTYMLENDALSASRFLSRFAKLMRHILENSKHEFISLENEIEFLNDYLHIQQLRSNESFQYEINVDKQDEISQLMIPPMLSQPFVENAIDHGIRNISWGGKIRVSFSVNAKNLNVTIEDNGVGFYQSKERKEITKNHKSAGIENARQRIQILTDKYKSKPLFEITDLSHKNPAKPGTIVTFAIPIIYA